MRQKKTQEQREIERLAKIAEDIKEAEATTYFAIRERDRKSSVQININSIPEYKFIPLSEYE